MEKKMNISYDYYKIFYFVARYGSFTRAAEVLMNNQPNITRSIKNLEGELGCTLFVRSNKGVTLTAEGEKLFIHISAAVEQITAGEEELSFDKSLQGGTVSVGASETALHGLLLPIIDGFHRKYPGIKIRISNHSTPQALNALKNGLADIAVVTTPADISKPLSKKIIKSFREAAVCGERLAYLSKEPLSIEKLCSYPLISLGRETKTFEFYSNLFLSHGLLFRPDIEVATADQILPMVRNNLGIGFLPEALARESVQRGEIYEITLSDKIPERFIILVKRSDHSLSIAAKELEKMIYLACSDSVN